MKLIEFVKNVTPFNVIIDDELSFSDKKKTMVNDFVDFVVNYLSIKGTFTVHIVDSRENNDITTTAYYQDSNKKVVILGRNRMLLDILRSLAHELVHKRQYEEDRVKPPIQDVGGEIEDEANAVAGILIKLYLSRNSDGLLYENHSK
jgi:Zn-dependent peptidase ImmA (M78 family)